MTTYVALVNELLRRMNEVPLDVAGEGFDTVRNVQALAKDAINSSVRLILQDGQEWPFLKTVHTQVLTAGTRQYDFPSSYSSVDWDTFYLKSLSSVSNAPTHLKVISYEDYIQNHRSSDDTGDLVLGDGAPSLVYQTFGDAFGVTPVPNAAYEVEYVYWAAPEDMVVFDDVCIIPNRFKHVIIEGAMMYMMRFRNNDQSASLHQNSFEDALKAMRRVLMDDITSVRSTVIMRNSTFSGAF